MEKTFIAIDLKSFYASVECAERGLDPLTTNLVVADESRTEKTICLAVSPSLKSYGVPGRPRLFEVIQKIEVVNRLRERNAPGGKLTGESWDNTKLIEDKSLGVSYIIAPPRMAFYIQYSTKIYDVYLRYVAPEDMHVYSVDEVFIDATPYLKTYNMTGRELAMTMIRDVLKTTGITATVGIGTNMYLAKIAMDIVAKKMPPDKDGVRIAELDEMSYRRQLWDHRPITDFWRVGGGTARRLASAGMYTMGDVALISVQNEEILYKMFGINAELLIDHAWGWEPTEIKDVHDYRPENNSLSNGQVLKEPYPCEKALIVVKEMADQLAFELLGKHLVTSQIVLMIGYDRAELAGEEVAAEYRNKKVKDHYGREIPAAAHGSFNLERQTALPSLITEAAVSIFEKTVDPRLFIRRINISAMFVVPEHLAKKEEPKEEQYSLFEDIDNTGEKEKKAAALEKEKRKSDAMYAIREKYGKNAILKGISYRDGATTRERNEQIGGHKA